LLKFAITPFLNVSLLLEKKVALMANYPPYKTKLPFLWKMWTIKVICLYIKRQKWH